MIEKIKNAAKNLGACKLIGEIKDNATLSQSFFSPQGREFCAKYNFPSLDMFRQIKSELTEDMGFFVDFGHLYRSNDGSIALIGETHGELNYNGCTEAYRIVLMHGAKATIKASNYALLQITNIGGCEINIEKDDTVIVL